MVLRDTDASARNDAALIALLAGVTAIGPFAMHMLAPALPSVALAFDISAAAAQLMLSLSLVAMALSNLVWGPVSDRFGRRPVLMAGLALAAVGSLTVALSTDLTVAIFGRVLQAAGASSGMVLARAVAQDIYGRSRSADVIGKITGVMVAAPMIAPTISGIIVETSGWRGVFWLAAMLCVALLMWSRSALGETAPRTGELSSPFGMLRSFAEIGRLQSFWRFAGFSAFSLAGFYYFVAIAPYVMRETFSAGPALYGVYFMFLSGTYMATNFVAGWFSARFGAERIMTTGALLTLIGPVLVMTFLAMGVHDPLVLFLPGMIQSFGAGIATPNSMAGAVGVDPARAGAASGLLGFTQFMLASLTTQVAGFVPHDTAWVVPIGMGVCLIASCVCLFGLKTRA